MRVKQLLGLQAPNLSELLAEQGCLFLQTRKKGGAGGSAGGFETEEPEGTYFSRLYLQSRVWGTMRWGDKSGAGRSQGKERPNEPMGLGDQSHER